jgi:plasmid maintenance system antidote protein VapI
MTQARIPSDRPPTPPGEMLLQEFIIPLGMTQADWLSGSAFLMCA